MTPTLVVLRTALHLAGRRSPEALLVSFVQTCSSRFGAAGFSAAPAVWQSSSCSPGCYGISPSSTTNFLFIA